MTPAQPRHEEEPQAMQPLIEPHRRQLRDTLARTMPPEGADAVLAALPASEADMPATKDFVRAEINDVRKEMTAGFARLDANTNNLRVEMAEKFAAADANLNTLRVEMHDVSASMKRWIVVTGIALAGVVLTAVNLPS